VLLTMAVVAAGLVVTSPASAREDLTTNARAVALPPPAPGVVRITEANLLSGQPAPDFQSDVATVLSNQPDFIAYNEVPYRLDGFLAPPGYALWRTPGQYTGETPVAWRTDKWTAINQGTTTVSYKEGKLPGQKVEWGIRYANWVTLQGVDGHVISVISAHLAPESEITMGLQDVGVTNLGILANQLAASGPVLMAGDMNFHYGPLQYPRELLASYGFTSTYDVTGTHFPTGDHRGATIDYVFMKAASQFILNETRGGGGIALGLIGRKGRDFFKRRGFEVRSEQVGIFQRLAFSHAAEVANVAIEDFISGQASSVHLVYNEFKSVMSQRILVEQLLPIPRLEPDTKAGPTIDYLYEPGPEEIFRDLLPRYVQAQVYRALLESNAAFFAAQMTAMDAATRNSSEMIDGLTLYMNKIRQAAITREIIEVVSGA